MKSKYEIFLLYVYVCTMNNLIKLVNSKSITALSKLIVKKMIFLYYVFFVHIYIYTCIYIYIYVLYIYYIYIIYIYIYYIYVCIYLYIYIYIYIIWNKTTCVGTTSFLVSCLHNHTANLLIAVNLQYNGIKITKQSSDINYMKSVPISVSLARIMQLVWSVLCHILSEYGDLLCKSPYPVKILEKFHTREKLRTWTLSTQWSGYVVHKLKFVFASTLRDKFVISLV